MTVAEELRNIQDIAEQFQKDALSFVTELVERNKSLSYQDALNVWIYKKLAQMEHRHQQLVEVLIPILKDIE